MYVATRGELCKFSLEFWNILRSSFLGGHMTILTSHRELGYSNTEILPANLFSQSAALSWVLSCRLNCVTFIESGSSH